MQWGQDLRLAPSPPVSTWPVWRVVAGQLRNVGIGKGNAEQEGGRRPTLKEETRIQR